MEKRRFLLSDGMVLVVAVAVGFAWARTVCPDPLVILDRFQRWSSLAGSLYAAGTLWMVLYPIVSILSLALLILGLRHPRPRRSRLVRQPGFVASFLASGGTAFAGIAELLLATNAVKFHVHSSREDIFIMLWFGTACAVLGVWACLWMWYGWRAEPSWLDRAGRLLGLYWVVVPVPTATWFFLIALE